MTDQPTYNAASDLIERNLAAGRGGKLAFIDDHGQYSYADLAGRVARCANALRARGIEREQRILLCLHDGIDFPTAFLGAIRAGIVPVPVNTQLAAAELAFMLADSRARLVIVSAPVLPTVAQAVASLPTPRPSIIVSDPEAGTDSQFSAMLRAVAADGEAAPTHPDEPCFWLYSSGSTGRPKGVVHVQTSLALTAALYAIPVLGIVESDIVYSAAKLFFAYGLGNALTFPMAVGATSVLLSERPTPAAIIRVLREKKPTIFYGVPTLYAALLASNALPERGEIALRCCVSAGEALPEDIGRRWTERFGIEILDGIGSTEMLHIFLSNQPGKVRYGTTGVPVPGYEIRLVDEEGVPVRDGEIGELQVAGPTSAAYYWNNRAKSRETFLGPWTRSGDKYTRDAQGYYTYGGRTDDMLKVSGMYVSPFEVEAALMTHPDVLEAAVIGREDQQKLVKPKAFVVLKPGHSGSPALAEALQAHVKARLAPYKYPRWVEFLDELPKTATGKIQRFKLREMDRR